MLSVIEKKMIGRGRKCPCLRIFNLESVMGVIIIE